MGQPTSLLGKARAFARDFPRDQMPEGYLWDVVDFVPSILDASLTGRGGWKYVSLDTGADIESGIFATYLSGDQLLTQNAAGQLHKIDPNTGIATLRGPVPRAVQNPIQLFETVVHFDAARGVVPTLIGASGAPAPMHSSAPKAKVGALWQNSVMSDGGPGREDTLVFGVPSQPDQPYDVLAYQKTAGEITALGSIRNVGLVFHKGSTEKLRGTTVPNQAGDEPGDLMLEPFSSSVGCPEPGTIAYWGDNCIWADEHGVHMSDGAIIKNIASQGGIQTFWRSAWDRREAVWAGTFLDYYVITIRSTPNRPPLPGPHEPGLDPLYPIPPAPDFKTYITLICDLNRRQWVRFSNVNATCYISSAGGAGTGIGSGTEYLWAGIAGTKRLANISACFFPDLYTGDAVVDGNGISVFPVFDTPWYRLAEEGRKRIRFAYLSYDTRMNPAGPAMQMQYIRSPQQVNYTNLGMVPSTTEYRRFRLPVGQAPYGIAFRVSTATAASAVRVFDLGVEAHPQERSRV